MKIKIITMSGDESTYEVDSFEMRANQVDNWVKLTLKNGETLVIYKIATIKSEDT